MVTTQILVTLDPFVARGDGYYLLSLHYINRRARLLQCLGVYSSVLLGELFIARYLLAHLGIQMDLEAELSSVDYLLRGH